MSGVSKIASRHWINEFSNQEFTVQPTLKKYESNFTAYLARSRDGFDSSTAHSAPLHIDAHQTQPDIEKDIVPAIKRVWPGISNNAARAIVAHMRLESGGKLHHCYNYNIGNIKAGSHEKHMNLRNVSEMLPVAQARKEVANNPSTARINFNKPTQIRGSEEYVEVIFNPPHPQTRFKAYDTLDEGLRSFVERHKRYAQDPEYQKALDMADADAIAKGLYQRHYFTASEHDYAAGLKKLLQK